MDFFFIVAEYLFLKCVVPVVEIEFAVILPRLKSINQYDPQFTLTNGRIVPFSN